MLGPAWTWCIYWLESDTITGAFPNTFYKLVNPVIISFSIFPVFSNQHTQALTDQHSICGHHQKGWYSQTSEMRGVLQKEQCTWMESYQYLPTPWASYHTCLTNSLRPFDCTQRKPRMAASTTLFDTTLNQIGCNTNRDHIPLKRPGNAFFPFQPTIGTFHFGQQSLEISSLWDTHSARKALFPKFWILQTEKLMV